MDFLKLQDQDMEDKDIDRTNICSYYAQDYAQKKFDSVKHIPNSNAHQIRASSLDSYDGAGNMGILPTMRILHDGIRLLQFQAAIVIIVVYKEIEFIIFALDHYADSL